MNSINPERLQNVVTFLSQRKRMMDSYIEAYVFRPYGIDIKNCLRSGNLVDVKKLMDFSFNTRQGGQPKAAIKNYEKEKRNVLVLIKNSWLTLVNKDLEPKKRFVTALANINAIKDVGQKISSMFIKFLVYYSDYFEGRNELIKELFIPFDSHVLKLLFVKFNGKKTNRLNLYDEAVNQAALKYETEINQEISLKENKLVMLQKNIQEDFENLGIEEPPIILDYLWYVGSMYCSRRFGDIGCSICFLRNECDRSYEF